MSCEFDFETLSTFVDGELEGDRAKQIRDHLDSCDACRDEVRRLKATKHAVSRLSGRRAPTEALRARFDSMRFESDASSGTRIPRFAGIAVGMLLLALAGLGVWWKGQTNSPQWANLLVDDHLHSVPAAKPADVTSNDPRVVRAFFERRVDFSPVVPELDGMTLIGGRLCTLEGQRVELLFYERGGQVLSLFVSGGDQFPERCAESKDHNVCVRKTDSHEYMMVGAVDSDVLRNTLDSL